MEKKEKKLRKISQRSLVEIIRRHSLLRYSRRCGRP